MKKAVAFLLAFLIFFTPMTTFVKADVVIGDNDDTIVNENATILGRKLAMLESLSELALSGVTEFTISNTEDVDTYFDSLWSEVNSAIDYLNSGEWVGDIPDKIASKYLYNLVSYRDIVNNRGEFLGFDLQNPTTSLLKTYFANDTYGKKYTSTDYYGTLDTLRALSVVRSGDVTPDIPPDFSFISHINEIWSYGHQFIGYNGLFSGSMNSYIQQSSRDTLSVSYMANNLIQSHSNQESGGFAIIGLSPILTINVNTSDPNNVTCTYSPYNYIGMNPYIDHLYWYYQWQSNLDCFYQEGKTASYFPGYPYNQSSFVGLSTCINYIYQHYANINLYVDGVPWALVRDVSFNPIIDIDGFLKIYGNDQPQQYQLQPNTQIDYDQLYQVIYNAIRDNLPISQGDINYYDSHDTIYSPTIINNYGDEEGEESDLIDTILDYAVIPKFDTAIAQPMRQALTNGVVIMNNSITNVIPNEILIILGACFFLLLFAVVINRMIK